MGKLLVALAVIFIGAVAGWYAFGSGGGVKIPRLTDFTGTKTTAPAVTPTPADQSGGLLRYTEEAYEATPGDTGVPKGGTGVVAITTGTPAPTAAATNVTGITRVEYGDNGFAPQILTVKVNTGVTFVNTGSGSMWVASNPHPTHDILPDFDQKQSVGKNGTYTYTFGAVGTWIYHNHMSPGHTGTVIVKK